MTAELKIGDKVVLDDDKSFDAKVYHIDGISGDEAKIRYDVDPEHITFEVVGISRLSRCSHEQKVYNFRKFWRTLISIADKDHD